MTKPDLIWVDLETTGLDKRKDRVLEVAVVLTDDELNELAAESWPVRMGWRARRKLERNADVHRMHLENGLKAEAAHGAKLRVVDSFIQGFLTDNGMPLALCGDDLPPQKAAPLAGSSVHFDRAFIERDFRYFPRYLHYRNVDVSSVKEVVRRWFPDVYETRPGQDQDKAHRALADVRASIEELRHYVRALAERDARIEVSGELKVRPGGSQAEWC